MKASSTDGLRATPEFPYGVAFQVKERCFTRLLRQLRVSWEFAFAITGERGPSVNRALLQRVMGRS